jgi:hypothetical protein
MCFSLFCRNKTLMTFTSIACLFLWSKNCGFVDKLLSQSSKSHSSVRSFKSNHISIHFVWCEHNFNTFCLLWTQFNPIYVVSNLKSHLNFVSIQNNHIYIGSGSVDGICRLPSELESDLFSRRTLQSTELTPIEIGSVDGKCRVMSELESNQFSRWQKIFFSEFLQFSGLFDLNQHFSSKN